jgi:YfiH family protein
LQARPLAACDWLVHGFSTRAGGSSKLAKERVLSLGYTKWDSHGAVESNRRSFLAALGEKGMTLVTLRQIHSDLIHEVSSAPEHSLRGDALITRAPGLLLAVQTADCIPMLLADSKHRVVAAVHAGWRGTLKRIAAKTLGRMQMLYGTRPADVAAALGPAIGRCCYEVGPEVVQAFAGQFAGAAEWFTAPAPSPLDPSAPTFEQLSTGQEPMPLKWLTKAPPGHEPPAPRLYLDLFAANCRQLLDAGLRPENIAVSDLCTACRTDLLFSHRREQGHTGRLMGVIAIRR